MLGFSAFILLCLLIVVSVFKYSERQVSLKICYYKKCCEIENFALVLERKCLQYNHEGKLYDYPLIKEYLGQCTLLLNGLGSFFDGIRFGTIAKEKRAKDLVLEMLKAPDEIQKIFMEQFSLIEQIYAIKHPLKYSVAKLKKGF